MVFQSLMINFVNFNWNAVRWGFCSADATWCNYIHPSWPQYQNDVTDQLDPTGRQVVGLSDARALGCVRWHRRSITSLLTEMTIRSAFTATDVKIKKNQKKRKLRPNDGIKEMKSNKNAKRKRRRVILTQRQVTNCWESVGSLFV